MEEPRSALNNLAILRLLPDDARKLVVDCFSPRSYSFGQAIVRQGDAVDGFYAVASGQARVVKQTEDGTEVSLDLLRPGDTFGEMELMEQTARMATVRASSDVVVYKLDSSVFQALVQSRPDIRNYFELQIRYRHLQSFFRLYSPFASLSPEALRALLADLRIVSAERGELIFRQGDPAGPMYVVREGRLRVFTENDRQRSYRAYLRKGDFFGEMASGERHARTASRR
jgi:ATP-binding cassette subfamily B protein